MAELAKKVPPLYVRQVSELPTQLSGVRVLKTALSCEKRSHVAVSISG